MSTTTGFVNIIQTEDKSFTVRLASSSTGDPYDLTGVTEIAAKFLASDGVSCVISLLSLNQIQILSSVLGKIYIILDETQTGLLKDGEGLNIEIQVTMGTQVTIIQLLGVLNVYKKLFPC